MHWSTGRQLLYAFAVIVALAAIGAGGYFGLVYHPPSCTDGVKNQNEEGIDCGGACQKLCVAPNVSALWVRSVKVASGVYHVVALVKNPDTTAAGSVPYTVSLYDEKNILIVERDGTITLSPGEVTPVFEANVVTGERVPAHTFISFGMSTWLRTARTPLPVTIISSEPALDAPEPRLSATLSNNTAFVVPDALVTALLYSADGTLIGASQTHSGEVPAQGRKNVVFTWPTPFMTAPATWDILPHLSGG